MIFLCLRIFKAILYNNVLLPSSGRNKYTVMEESKMFPQEPHHLICIPYITSSLSVGKECVNMMSYHLCDCAMLRYLN